LYFALKKEGVVNSKEEFWLRMDLKDLESAGAFIPRETWDSFIVKKDTSKVKFKPRDYTK
jgi:hypothetical protein